MLLISNSQYDIMFTTFGLLSLQENGLIGGEAYYERHKVSRTTNQLLTELFVLNIFKKYNFKDLTHPMKQFYIYSLIIHYFPGGIWKRVFHHGVRSWRL